VCVCDRWDSKGLSSHGKVIFEALDNLVSEASGKYVEQGGIHDIQSSLQDLVSFLTSICLVYN